MKVPKFLHSLFSSHKTVSFESPGQKNHIVESVSNWRALKRGERDADLVPFHKILIDFYRCDLCGCSIGPGYDQQKMYLYPVRDEQCYSWKIDRMKYYTIAWLKICESCGHNRSRYLPSFLLILRPEYWTTTMLLCKEEEQPQWTNMQDARVMGQIRSAITDTINAFATYLFLVILVSYGISLSLFRQRVLPFRKIVLLGDDFQQMLDTLNIEEMSPVLSLDFTHLQQREDRSHLA